MQIFVVSRSRWKHSKTLDSLRDAKSEVHLVVPKSQRKQYVKLAKEHKCELLACPVDGIARTREYCGNIAHHEKFLMLDDDLTFFRRISPKSTKLRKPTDLMNCNIQSLLEEVSVRLEEYVHVAVSAREGNNRLPHSGVECSRPLRALAYQREEFVQLEHGRVKIMEDFDVTMQLLKKGHKNFIISSWAQDQVQTQMDGGCSDYRTLKLHNTNVKKFAELHKEFVRVRQKENKTGGQFGKRMEATIYWKKAYESSKRK